MQRFDRSNHPEEVRHRLQRNHRARGRQSHEHQVDHRQQHARRTAQRNKGEHNGRDRRQRQPPREEQRHPVRHRHAHARSNPQHQSGGGCGHRGEQAPLDQEIQPPRQAHAGQVPECGPHFERRHAHAGIHQHVHRNGAGETDDQKHDRVVEGPHAQCRALFEFLVRLGDHIQRIPQQIGGHGADLGCQLIRHLLGSVGLGLLHLLGELLHGRTAPSRGALQLLRLLVLLRLELGEHLVIGLLLCRVRGLHQGLAHREARLVKTGLHRLRGDPRADRTRLRVRVQGDFRPRCSLLRQRPLDHAHRVLREGLGDVDHCEQLAAFQLLASLVPAQPAQVQSLILARFGRELVPDALTVVLLLGAAAVAGHLRPAVLVHDGHREVLEVTRRVREPTQIQCRSENRQDHHDHRRKRPEDRRVERPPLPTRGLVRGIPRPLSAKCHRTPRKILDTLLYQVSGFTIH